MANEELPIGIITHDETRANIPSTMRTQRRSGDGSRTGCEASSPSSRR